MMCVTFDSRSIFMIFQYDSNPCLCIITRNLGLLYYYSLNIFATTITTSSRPGMISGVMMSCTTSLSLQQVELKLAREVVMVVVVVVRLFRSRAI